MTNNKTPEEIAFQIVSKFLDPVSPNSIAIESYIAQTIRNERTNNGGTIHNIVPVSDEKLRIISTDHWNNSFRSPIDSFIDGFRAAEKYHMEKEK